jgi:hypothetical protein
MAVLLHLIVGTALFRNAADKSRFRNACKNTHLNCL